VAGRRLGTAQLIASGARGIVFVGGVEARSVTAERVSGFLDAIEEHGPEQKTIPGRPSLSFWPESSDRFVVASDSDAAVCLNDLVVLGVISGFARRGRFIGRDLQLVGFDDCLTWDSPQRLPPLSCARSWRAATGATRSCSACLPSSGSASSLPSGGRARGWRGAGLRSAAGARGGAQDDRPDRRADRAALHEDVDRASQPRGPPGKPIQRIDPVALLALLLSVTLPLRLFGVSPLP
jgi:hypothetical protein